MSKLQVLRVSFGVLLFAMVFAANSAFAVNAGVAVCLNGVTSYENNQNQADKFVEENTGATLGECPEDEEEIPTPPEEESVQITICHYESEDEEWKILTINSNAFGGHEGHNDGDTSDFVIDDESDQTLCDELIAGPVTPEVDETAPDMPVHVSPSNGATLTSAELTEIQWTDVTDPSTPVSYYYESSNNSGTNPDGSFVSPAYQSGALSNSEIAAAGTPEGIWYWHVRARDFIGNFSAWTGAWQIIVDNTPPEEPEYPYGMITNPSIGEEVFGLIDLTAEYFDGDEDNDDAVQWAVRAGTCEANTGTVAGNVDGFNDSFTWDGNMFSAPFDADLFEPGEYCFVFNPTDDGEVNVREAHTFFIVEEESEPVYGCMDSEALNYNSLATELGEVVCEYEDSNEEQTEEVSNSEEDEEDGQRSGRRRGGSVLGATTDGEVLGASTDSCDLYIVDYMKKGHSNSSEVEKLQNFLNLQGFVVPVTGVFGDLTEEAVKQFQNKYKEDFYYLGKTLV